MADAAAFKLQVLQGGIDLSGRIHRSGVVVDAQVRAARTCTYLYTVASEGAIDPESLVGASVEISVDVGSGMQRIFTGKINRAPAYDPFSRTMAVNATDSYQEFVDSKTLAELQALVPGSLYSEPIDGLRVSGLQQMQALLSTVSQDAFLDNSGAFVVTDWVPKAAGSEDGIALQSGVAGVSASLAESDQLVNEVSVVYEHTFGRRIWNRISFAWQFGPGPGFARWPSWCDWYQTSGHELPLRDMVVEAAYATNWLPIGGITMQGHPESFGTQGESALCGAGIGWILTDYFRTEVIDASWHGGRQYGVESREQLTMTVSSPSSVTTFGVRHMEMRHSVSTPAALDAADAEKDPNLPTDFIGYGGGGNQAYRDDIDLAARSANIQAILAKARVKILASHRQNSAAWTQLITPAIDLGQTWKIDHPIVQATGTVVRLRHAITRESALTTVTIGPWIGGGGTDDALTEPSFAPAAPTHLAPADVFIENKIGGRAESADYDPAWEQASNWIGNHPVTTLNPSKVYPVRLVIVPPDITEDMRRAVDHPAAASYSVQIPATSIALSGGS